MADTITIPRAAWDEICEVMNLMRSPSVRDPKNHEIVKSLGSQIGFGAMMSVAEQAWRERLQERGYPVGGEFVAGPCRATVDKLIAMLDEINEKERSDDVSRCR